MSLWHQGRREEARKVLAEAGAAMAPTPEDGDLRAVCRAPESELILWLVYKEAKALLGANGDPTVTAE